MYIVTIKNGLIETQIHNVKQKLKNGKIVKGINTIDTFSFSMLPNNDGFGKIRDYATLVYVFNTNKQENEFVGRVLYAETTMDESGLITKNVTCESIAGYLCDSVQDYVETKNWTVRGLLQHLIDCHNSQVESEKHFILGEVTVEDKNDNLYVGISREKTWNAITSNLINILGGEFSIRHTDDANIIDYVTEIGEQKDTEIKLSVNMKSIIKEQNPTEYVTRLIPLGCKLTQTDQETGEEVQSEQRLDITSVNNGLKYIDDEQGVEMYGIHVAVVEWDDVTVASNLYDKGIAWLKENNRVQVKYTITALDLSLIGLATDDFSVGNTHHVINNLLGIDDYVRIIKKSIDICEEVKSTIEIGDNFKTLSDIQRDQAIELQSSIQTVQKMDDSAKDILRQISSIRQEVKNVEETFRSEIKGLSDSIKLKITGSLGSKASILLTAGTNENSYELDLSQIRKAFADDPTAISISAGTITFNSNTLIINSTNFTLDSAGKITATAGEIGGWSLKNYKLYAGDGSAIKTVCVQAPTANNLYVFAAGGTSHDSYADCPFRVTKAGKLYATDAIISGEVTTISGNFKAELNSGSLELYYNNVLCGTLNTKYWTGASTEGISLRIEEGGNYIMFSHPSDAGTGYDVDYYLNYGWSTNYDEKHIFQTSARFLDKVYFSGSGAYFKDIYLYDNNFVRSCASDGTVGEEMLGYSSDRVNVGSVGCPTMLRGTSVYLKNTSTTVTSDRSLKNSIEALSEEYERFLDGLEPVRYKYNEGTSGRYHVGYIAQDVKSALAEAGLSTLDFAGFVDMGSDLGLGLSYDNFIALLHLKIKRLQERIVALESGV